MGWVDQPIIGGMAHATREQGRRYLRAENRRVAALRGVPPLANDEVDDIIDAYWTNRVSYEIAADAALAQALVETASFTFGNQVAATQHNPAGLGATNDGAAGGGWPTWFAGVAAQFIHLCAWCGDVRGARDYRLAAVKRESTVKGYATTWRSLGGRWAVKDDVPWADQATMPHAYGDSIEAHWRAMGNEERTMKVRVAIASGHHNTDGGDSGEYTQTGKLTQSIARQCTRLGMEVRVLQPDGPDADTERGDGQFPGGIWDVARAVVALREQGWVPDIFIETHTEGGGTTGGFAIFPDWGDDIDIDVKLRLGPELARRVAAATGLGVRRAGKDGIPGVCSEKETGVGASGFRLGIFNLTAPLAATTTRLIFEYGAHDKEPDISISKRADFYDNAGRATAEAFLEFMGGVVPVATETKKEPLPLDEAGILRAWSEGLDPSVRGNLLREGTADLVSFGGTRAERVCLYERLVTHRLKGSNYVMLLEVWDQLRHSGNIHIYPSMPW